MEHCSCSRPLFDAEQTGSNSVLYVGPFPAFFYILPLGTACLYVKNTDDDSCKPGKLTGVVYVRWFLLAVACWQVDQPWHVRISNWSVWCKLIAWALQTVGKICSPSANRNNQEGAGTYFNRAEL